MYQLVVAIATCRVCVRIYVAVYVAVRVLASPDNCSDYMHAVLVWQIITCHTHTIRVRVHVRLHCIHVSDILHTYTCSVHFSTSVQGGNPEIKPLCTCVRVYMYTDLELQELA